MVSKVNLEECTVRLFPSRSRTSLLLAISALLLVIAMKAQSVDRLLVEVSEMTQLLSSDPSDIKFYLYNNRNPVHHHELVLGDVYSIIAAGFDPERPVKIIVHGFLGSAWTETSQMIKNAYLRYRNSEFNIICVDWSKLSTPKPKGANIIFYTAVETNMPIAGRQVGKFIDFLVHHKFAVPSDIHLIGFSLGAHVVSNAAEFIRQKTASKVGRVTGLDPARIISLDLIGNKHYKTLRRSNAQFVDVVHTNTAFLGLPGDLGHADFYVNGGKTQPGCYDAKRDSLAALKEPIIGRNRAYWMLCCKYADLRTNNKASSICSHFRAPTYFAKSINPEFAVTACKCISWPDSYEYCVTHCKDKIIFGDRCPKNARGRYYVEWYL